VKDGVVEVRTRKTREDRRVPPRGVAATVKEITQELSQA